MTISSNLLIQVPASKGADIQPLNERYILVSLDTTESEEGTGQSTISKAPTPFGHVSDHVTDDGVTLTITGLISNTPMVFEDWSWTRAADAINAIERIRRDGVLVSVTTGLRTYNNLIITKFKWTRSGPPKTSVQVSLDFQQVATYTPEMTLVDPEVLREPEHRRTDCAWVCGGGEGELSSVNDGDGDVVGGKDLDVESSLAAAGADFLGLDVAGQGGYQLAETLMSGGL